MEGVVTSNPEYLGRDYWTTQVSVGALCGFVEVTIACFEAAYAREMKAKEALVLQEEQRPSQGRRETTKRRERRTRLQHHIKRWERHVEELRTELTTWRGLLDLMDPEQFLTVRFEDYKFFAHTPCPAIAEWISSFLGDEDEDEEEMEDPF